MLYDMIIITCSILQHYQKYRGHLEYNLKVVDKHRSRWSEGDWTDDSDQMILIMRTIIKCKQVN